jgi:hypothetical protein
VVAVLLEVVDPVLLEVLAPPLPDVLDPEDVVFVDGPAGDEESEQAAMAANTMQTTRERADLRIVLRNDRSSGHSPYKRRLRNEFSAPNDSARMQVFTVTALA